jgi:hypothetical protein
MEFLNWYFNFEINIPINALQKTVLSKRVLVNQFIILTMILIVVVSNALIRLVEPFLNFCNKKKEPKIFIWFII